MDADGAVLRAGTGPVVVASARPFVKWVGGKGRLMSQLRPLLPRGIERMRHVEPFVGGGAMFFARQPRRALLSDINPDLVHAYRCVRDDVAGVIAALAELARVGHDPDTYYAVRARYNAGEGLGRPLRAALFIYLNKTCFNGLHRVNQRGEFNVPVGRYRNPTLLDVTGLRAASAALRGVEVRCAAFDDVLATVDAGDFVSLDPPYEPASATSSFTRYAHEGFTREDQLRLREAFGVLVRRGAAVMLTNSDVPFVRALYADYDVTPIQAARAINANPSRRGPVAELVVRAVGRS